MIPIKVSCACGQKYAFDVEPVNGRMPSAIACPVCGADGTGVANDIIARSMPSPPPPPLSAQAQPQPAQGGVVVMSGREGAAALMKHIAAASKQSGGHEIREESIRSEKYAWPAAQIPANSWRTIRTIAFGQPRGVRPLSPHARFAASPAAAVRRRAGMRGAFGRDRRNPSGER